MSNSSDINSTSSYGKKEIISEEVISEGKKYNPVKNIILGDSMIKQTKGLELPSKIEHRHSIYVRSFSVEKLEV